MSFIPTSPNYFSRDSLFPLLTISAGNVYGYEQAHIATAEYVYFNTPTTTAIQLTPDFLFTVDLGSEYQALTAAGYFNPNASTPQERDPFKWIITPPVGSSLSKFNQFPYIRTENRTEAVPQGGLNSLDWPYFGCQFLKFPDVQACYDEFISGVDFLLRGKNGTSIQNLSVLEWLNLKTTNGVQFTTTTYNITGTLNPTITNLSRPIEIDINSSTNKDVVLISKGPGHHILIGSTVPYLSATNFNNVDWSKVSQWNGLSRAVTSLSALSALSRFDNRFLPSLPFYWRIATIDPRSDTPTQNLRKYAGFFYVPSWSLFIANSATPVTYNNITQTYTWNYKFVTTKPHYSRVYSQPYSLTTVDEDGDEDKEPVVSIVGKHWENVFWRKYPNAIPWTIQFENSLNSKIQSIYFDIKFVKQYNEIYPQIIIPAGMGLKTINPIEFPGLELQVESVKWNFDAYFTLPELSARFDQYLPEFKFKPTQFNKIELTPSEAGLRLQDYPDQTRGFHLTQNDWHERNFNLPVGFNFPSSKFLAFYSPTINRSLSGSFHTHHFLSLDPSGGTLWPASSPAWKSFSPQASAFIPITYGLFESKSGPDSYTKVGFVNQNITNQTTTYPIDSKSEVGLVFYGRSNRATNNNNENISINDPSTVGLNISYGSTTLPVPDTGLLSESLPLSTLLTDASGGFEIKSKLPPHYFSIRSAVSSKNDPLSSLSALCHEFTTNFFLRTENINYSYIFGDKTKGVSAIEFDLYFVSDFNTLSYPISTSKVDKIYFVIRPLSYWTNLLNNSQKSPGERIRTWAEALQDFQMKFDIEYYNPSTGFWYSMLNPNIDENNPTTLQIPTSAVGKIRIKQLSPGINGRAQIIFYPVVESNVLKDTKFHVYKPLQLTFFASCPKGVIFNLDTFTWDSIVKEIAQTDVYYELDVECKKTLFSRLQAVLIENSQTISYLNSLSSSLTGYSGIKGSKIDLYISPPLSAFEKADVAPGWIDIDIFSLSPSNSSANTSGGREFIKTIRIDSTPPGSVLTLLPKGETVFRDYQKLTVSSNTDLITSLSSADFFNIKVYGNPQENSIDSKQTIIRIQSDRYSDSFFSSHIPEWEEWRNNSVRDFWSNASITLQVSSNPFILRTNNKEQIFSEGYAITGQLLKTYPDFGEIIFNFDPDSIFTWSVTFNDKEGNTIIPSISSVYISPLSSPSIKSIYYTASATQASAVYLQIDYSAIDDKFKQLNLFVQVINNTTSQVLSYNLSFPLDKIRTAADIPYHIYIKSPASTQNWIDTSKTLTTSALRGCPISNVPVTNLQLQCSLEKSFLQDLFTPGRYTYDSFIWCVSAQSTNTILTSNITQPDTIIEINIPSSGYENFVIWWKLEGLKNNFIWPNKSFKFESEKGYLFVVPELDLYNELNARLYPAEIFNSVSGRYVFTTPQNAETVSSVLIDGNKKDDLEPLFFKRRPYPFAPHTSVLLYEGINSTVLHTEFNSLSGYFYFPAPLLSALENGKLQLAIKAHSDNEGLLPVNSLTEHTDWFGYKRDFNIFEIAVPYSASSPAFSSLGPNDLLFLPKVQFPSSPSLSSLSTVSDLIYTGSETELDLMIKTGPKNLPFEYQFKQALYIIQVQSLENDWVYTTTMSSSSPVFISDPIKIRTTNGFLPASLNLANGENSLLVSVTARISSEFRYSSLSSNNPGGSNTANWTVFGNPERKILIHDITTDPLEVIIQTPQIIRYHISQNVLYEGDTVNFELDVVQNTTSLSPISGYYFSNNQSTDDVQFIPCLSGTNKVFFSYLYEHPGVYTPSVTALKTDGTIITKTFDYYINVLPLPSQGKIHKQITPDIKPVRVLNTNFEALQLPYTWEDIAINPGEFGHARVLQTSLNRLRECYNYLVENTWAIYSEIPLPYRVIYKLDDSKKRIAYLPEREQNFMARKPFGKPDDNIEDIACDENYLYVKYESGNLEALEFHSMTPNTLFLHPIIRSPGKLAVSFSGHKKFLTFTPDHLLVQIDQESNNPFKINAQFRIGGVAGFGTDNNKFYFPTKVRSNFDGSIIVVYDCGNNFLKVFGKNLNPIYVYELPESIVSFDFVLDQNNDIIVYGITPTGTLFIINITQSKIISRQKILSKIQSLETLEFTDIIISSDSRFFYVLTKEGILIKYTIFAEFLGSLKISNRPLIAATTLPYINSLLIATNYEIFQINDLYQEFSISSKPREKLFLPEIVLDVNELIIPQTFEKILKNFGSQVKFFHHTIYAEFVQMSYPGGRKFFNCIPAARALSDQRECDLDLESIQIGLNELFHPGVINRELRKIYDYLLCILKELQIQFVDITLDRPCGDFCWRWNALKSPPYLPYKQDCVINPITYTELRPSFSYTYAPTKIWQGAKGSCCE